MGETFVGSVCEHRMVIDGKPKPKKSCVRDDVWKGVSWFEVLGFGGWA